MTHPAQLRFSYQSSEGLVVLSETPQVRTNMIQLDPPETCDGETSATSTGNTTSTISTSTGSTMTTTSNTTATANATIKYNYFHYCYYNY